MLCQCAEIKLVSYGTFSFLVFIDFPSGACIGLHWFLNQTPQWTSQAGKFLTDRPRVRAVGRAVRRKDLERRWGRVFPEHKRPNIPNAYDTAAAVHCITEQSSCTCCSDSQWGSVVPKKEVAQLKIKNKNSECNHVTESHCKILHTGTRISEDLYRAQLERHLWGLGVGAHTL